MNVKMFPVCTILIIVIVLVVMLPYFNLKEIKTRQLENREANKLGGCSVLEIL